MKHLITSTALTLSMSLFSVSCSNKDPNSKIDEKQIALIQQQINNQDYDKAIAEIENIRKTQGSLTQELKQELFYAHAGLSGFEAERAKDLFERIRENVEKKIKESSQEWSVSSKLELRQALIESTDEFLATTPELSAKQKESLNRAIALYQELGLTLENAGAANNYKWALLHSYRMIFTLRDAVAELNSTIKSSQELISLDAALKMGTKYGAALAKDFHQSYLLLGSSYEAFRKISQTVDSLIAKVFKNEELTLKVTSILKDQSSFYKAFIQDNQKALSVIVAKAVEIFKVHTSEENLSSALSLNLPSEEEAQKSLERLASLVNVVIEAFLSENQEALEQLATVITPEMKEEYLTLLALVFTEDSETLDLRFEAFTQKYENEIANLVTLLDVILTNVDVASLERLEKEVNAEIAEFVAKIQLEIKEEELKRIEAALEQDLKIIELGLGAISRKNEAQLKAQQAKLEREIQELNDYLSRLFEGQEDEEVIMTEEETLEIEEIHQELDSFLGLESEE